LYSCKPSGPVSGLTKDMQTEQLLCLNGLTDIEHTNSGSNKENRHNIVNKRKFNPS